MKEQDKKLDLEFKSSLEDAIMEEVNSIINNSDDIEDYLRSYRDDEVDFLYDEFQDITQEVFSREIEKHVREETIFKTISNSNGHNIRPDYFKLRSLASISRVPITIESVENNTFKIIRGSRGNSGHRFQLNYVRIDSNSNTATRIKGASMLTNSVVTADMGIFEFPNKGIVKLSVLEGKKKELIELLEAKNKEAEEIKEVINNNDYIMTFMKKKNITYDLIENIKSGLILEAIEESKTDETVDVKTSVSEIINLEL